MKKTAGLTLIELLVSSAIIALVAGSGLAAYIDFNNRQILNTAADELKNNLRQARGFAMAGRKIAGCNGDLVGYQFSFLPGKQYQVDMICSDIVIVNTFSYNEKVIIPSKNPFTFQALTGATEENKFSILLSLGTKVKLLTVDANGEIF